MGENKSTSTILISGMTCLDCAEKIEATLGKLEGVFEVSVGYEQSKALITYDSDVCSIIDVLKTIGDLGYVAGVEEADLNSAFVSKYQNGSSRRKRKQIIILGIIVITIVIVMLLGTSILKNRTEKILMRSETITGNVAIVKGNKQTIKTTVDGDKYTPEVLVVQKDIPVKWIIEAKNLNGVNNPITLPELGIEKKLSIGENVVEFTPEKEGVMVYTCWMGMISANILVVPDLAKVTQETIKAYTSRDVVDFPIHSDDTVPSDYSSEDKCSCDSTPEESTSTTE